MRRLRQPQALTTTFGEGVVRDRRWLSILALAIGAACGGGRNADDSAMKPGQVPTLRQLAVAWSGGNTRPRCQDRGPNGEYLGGMGGQYCVWSTPAAVDAGNEVGAHTTASGTPTLLQWNRQMTGVADADRLVDSLRSALKAQGLVARNCPSGDAPAGPIELIEWDAPTLIIQLARITPPSGAPRFTTVATDMPKSVPDIMCPREKVL